MPYHYYASSSKSYLNSNNIYDYFANRLWHTRRGRPKREFCKDTFSTMIREARACDVWTKIGDVTLRALIRNHNRNHRVSKPPNTKGKWLPTKTFRQHFSRLNNEEQQFIGMFTA